MRVFLENHGMLLEAWYPLGHGDKKLMKEPVLAALSRKHEKSVAQIILRWHIQKGHVVFPKSVNEHHIKDNIDLYDFELTIEDISKIDAMNKNKSYFNRPEWLDRWMCKMSDKVPMGDKD